MKVGLLPLYIALYDEVNPGLRARLEAFYEEVAKCIEQQGVAVERVGFCRIKEEFDVAVSGFEKAGADAIVTLHMAYSPSLESIEALVLTKLPIIVLDTTQTLEFTPEQLEEEISYNHGIHGVMDMCSMLKRYGKAYSIVAGHYLESDCIARACAMVRAAVAAKAIGGAKVGVVGGAFEGMGDFMVEPIELKKRFGICVENVDPEILAQYKETVTAAALEKELAEDKKRFVFDETVSEEGYIEAVNDCLALRKCVEEREYTAFSVNFRKVDNIPFIECCKAMERGIGYAGEGDALTAAFTGALLAGYPETSFVEIFCPDWKNNLLFLSHMGEVNYRIVAEKPLVCQKGGFVHTHAAYSRMKGGKGVFVNISRGKEDYQLLLSPMEMMDCESDDFRNSMRGWLKLNGKTTAEFLEAYSRNGATHHSMFVYGATVEELEFFGRLLSMNIVVV